MLHDFAFLIPFLRIASTAPLNKYMIKWTYIFSNGAAMNIRMIKHYRKQLTSYVEKFKDLLGRQERQHWCFMYFSDLMLDGERKSIQPISEKLPGGSKQNIQQFVNQSSWLHQPI